MASRSKPTYMAQKMRCLASNKREMESGDFCGLASTAKAISRLSHQATGHVGCPSSFKCYGRLATRNMRKALCPLRHSGAPRHPGRKVVTSHLEEFPDRFAPDSKRTAFNDELKMRIDRFTGIAFDAKKNPSAAKAIVELFESKIEGKFSGHLYDILMEHVQGIYAESLDR